LPSGPVISLTIELINATTVLHPTCPASRTLLPLNAVHLTFEVSGFGAHSLNRLFRSDACSAQLGPPSVKNVSTGRLDTVAHDKRPNAKVVADDVCVEVNDDDAVVVAVEDIEFEADVVAVVVAVVSVPDCVDVAVVLTELLGVVVALVAVFVAVVDAEVVADDVAELLRLDVPVEDCVVDGEVKAHVFTR